MCPGAKVLVLFIVYGEQTFYGRSQHYRARKDILLIPGSPEGSSFGCDIRTTLPGHGIPGLAYATTPLAGWLVTICRNTDDTQPLLLGFWNKPSAPQGVTSSADS